MFELFSKKQNNLIPNYQIVKKEVTLELFERRIEFRLKNGNFHTVIQKDTFDNRYREGKRDLVTGRY